MSESSTTPQSGRRTRPGQSSPLTQLSEATLRRILLIPTINTVFAIVFLLVLALITGAWQVAAGSVFFALTVGLIVVAFRLVRAGRPVASGYLLLLAAGVTFGGPLLVWDGVTALLVLGGLTMIAFLADLLLSDRRWQAIAIGEIAFLLSVAFILSLPLPRYDVSQIVVIPIVLTILTLVGVAALFWQVWQQFKFGYIRTRLIIAFILIAVLPPLIVTAIIIPLSAAANEQRVDTQFTSLVKAKEAQINLWLEQLRLDLGEQVARDQATQLLPALFAAAPDTREFQLSALLIGQRLQQMLDYRQGFESISIVAPDGTVVLSTDPEEKTRNYSRDTALPIGLLKSYMAPPSFDRRVNRFVFNVYEPIADSNNQVVGVMIGRANLNLLNQVVSEFGNLGETGEVYLVKANGSALTDLRFGDSLQLAPSRALEQAAITQGLGRGDYRSYHGAPVYGAWLWHPDLNSALIVEQSRAEINQTQNLLIVISLVAVILTIGAAIALALVVGRSINRPIVQLQRQAEAVTQGNLTARAAILREDEMGSLAASFNSMAAQLQDVIINLEERVEARTAQMRTSAEVGRTAVSVLEPEQLMRDIVNLMAERFGFYYVAVFTLDTPGQYAILREATGEAGQILKERQHKLEVGGQSMVGYVIAQRRARIALDVGADAVRFANPLLPETRSEIALPLIVGDYVLGALDVQSTTEAAFDENSAILLQGLADQIAIALNNAQVFTEAEEAVRRSHTLLLASRHLAETKASVKAAVEDLMVTASPGLNLQRWWVVTFDPERLHLVPISTNAWLGANAALSVTSDVGNPLVRCALTGERFIINNALTDVRLQQIPPEQRASWGKFMAAPVVTRAAIVGVLACGRTGEGKDFTRADLEAAESLASLLAVALENQQLSQAAERAQNELTKLNRSVTSEDWFDFRRKHAQSQVKWIGAGQEIKTPEVEEAIARGQIAFRALSDRERLGVAVPIMLRDTPLGAFRLIVLRRQWNKELETTLESLAGHVAQAAENVRLLTATEDRLLRERALSEATDRVRHRSAIESILESAAAELARYLDAPHVTVRFSQDLTQSEDVARASAAQKEQAS
jgi:GAF domain-containing protein/HAMP domain-containing protein